MKGSARSIKRRLKSVTSIGQLTRAMKTVAISKYNRTLNRLAATRAYRQELAGVIELSGAFETAAPAGAQDVVYVVITANRGLNGAFNADLWALLEKVLAEETRPYVLVVCGQWGIGRAQERKTPNVIQTFAVSDLPEASQAAAIARYLRALWQKSQTQEINFVSQAFHNILRQSPQVHRLLPFDPPRQPSAEVIFVPRREGIVADLVERRLQSEVYKTLLSHMAGAHGATLMAMRTANDNALTMQRQLERTLNRIRQAAVTTQVLELSRYESAPGRE